MCIRIKVPFVVSPEVKSQADVFDAAYWLAADDVLAFACANVYPDVVVV